MPSLQTQNTQIFHASSIGRDDYLALTPNVAATYVGCGVVYSGINGLVQELEFSPFPVQMRPAALPSTTSFVTVSPVGVPGYVSADALNTDTVQYVPQTLTSPQKLQARSNIGASAALNPTSGWAYPLNMLTNRTLNANAVSHQELADLVATIIEDLKLVGIFTT